MALSVVTDDELREFIKRELRGSNEATLIRQLQSSGGGGGGAGSIPLVTSLPASAIEGQMVRFLADAVNGIEFLFAYRAASASPSKWEWVGGSDLIARDDAGGALTNAYANVGNCQVTLPLAGDWRVEATGGYIPNGSSVHLMGVSFNGVAVVDPPDRLGQFNASSSSFYIIDGSAIVKPGLAAGTVVRVQGRFINGSGTIDKLKLHVRPVRVG